MENVSCRVRTRVLLPLFNLIPSTVTYTARVFRVLIASPSDVTTEREIAVKTIQEWNDLHSANRQVVLLPLMWETHATPEYDKRPQEVINRQLVDHSDVLVAIFWTRIGSPTGVADSGTLEEIETAATQGKPVMLYFSKVPRSLTTSISNRLQKLRVFKTKTFPKALVADFTSQIDFRDKLAKHLETQVRTLVSEGAGDATDELPVRPITDVQLEFADATTGATARREAIGDEHLSRRRRHRQRT